MNQGFKNYFHFSRIERQGIIGLVIIMVLVIVARYILFNYDFKEDYQSEDLDKILAELMADTTQTKPSEPVTERETATETNPVLFQFNPNGLSISKWEKLGLSEKQALSIKRYEEKGGKFRKKSDVSKMYVISDELYRRLEPYILLPDSIVFTTASEDTFKTKFKPKKKFKREKVVVDINSADSATFLKLYGIGPYFSGKMVAYRNQLGGYVSKQQLTEIWRFSDSLLNTLDSQLVIGEIEIEQININLAEAKDLKSHPYISWNIANSIVNMRKQHGTYQALEEIKKSALINDSIYHRLMPYLKID